MTEIVPKEFEDIGIHTANELEHRREEAADFVQAYVDYVRRVEPHATNTIASFQEVLDSFPGTSDLVNLLEKEDEEEEEEDE